MSEVTFPEYQAFALDLKSASLSVTPAELHGLLTGMLSGGLAFNDASWQPVLFDYTNDGMGWSSNVLGLAESVFKITVDELTGASMELSMLLPDDSDQEGLFDYAEALSEWVNHFISGLGLGGADLKKVSEQGKEALADLEEIAKLGIDEDDDLKEQAELLEQVIEHVKACVLTLHADFGQRQENADAPIDIKDNPTIH